VTLCVYHAEYCFVSEYCFVAGDVRYCMWTLSSACRSVASFGVSLQVLLPVCIVHVVVCGRLIMLFFCKVSTNVGSIIRWLLATCVTVFGNWLSCPLTAYAFHWLSRPIFLRRPFCNCHYRRWFHCCACTMLIACCCCCCCCCSCRS